MSDIMQRLSLKYTPVHNFVKYKSFQNNNDIQLNRDDIYIINDIFINNDGYIIRNDEQKILRLAYCDAIEKLNAYSITDLIMNKFYNEYYSNKMLINIIKYIIETRYINYKYTNFKYINVELFSIIGYYITKCYHPKYHHVLFGSPFHYKIYYKFINICIYICNSNTTDNDLFLQNIGFTYYYKLLSMYFEKINNKPYLTLRDHINIYLKYSMPFTVLTDSFDSPSAKAAAVEDWDKCKKLELEIPTYIPFIYTHTNNFEKTSFVNCIIRYIISNNKY